MTKEEIIQKFLAYPGLITNGAGSLSKRWNATREDVVKAREEARKILKEKAPYLASNIEAFEGTYIKREERETEVNNEKGTFKSTVWTDFEPKNDEELAELHKVNLTKYKISNYYSKYRNGKFGSTIFCALKKPQDYSPEDFSKFLETYKPQPIEWSYVDATRNGNLVDVEISIADFHLAKKTLGGESLEDRKKQFLSVLNELAFTITGSFQIRKLVFPISNDFFHTDTYQNTTTAGTPQDVLVSYDKEYEEGFDILVSAITYLQSLATQIEVILVQGNHDRTKSFYLAHALEVYFKDHVSISFQRQHSTTKSVVLGETFIGYHHGNCKLDDLPLLFATGADASKFGNAKYREVHTGDKHHYMAKEVKGVRIQQMPSLSSTDRWHEDNNFVNSIRAGLALIYHPSKGKIGEFESRI